MNFIFRILWRMTTNNEVDISVYQSIELRFGSRINVKGEAWGLASDLTNKGLYERAHLWW